jgi:nucleotide-binding universal stress UspA family protein
MDLVSLHPEIERVLRRDLTAKVNQLLGDEQAEIRIQVGFGRAADHLIQLAEEEQSELLVVGTHQRKGLSKVWHGSVSQGVLHHARTSVACIPAAASAECSTEAVGVVKHVLAATDLSDLGNRAVAHAYSVLPAGGTVFLIYVVDPDHAAQTSSAGGDPITRLNALIPNEAPTREIKTHVEVVGGRDAAAVIAALAERVGADLICMGSHGRTGLSKALFGSVAQGVLTRSARPVLLIRPPRED